MLIKKLCWSDPVGGGAGAQAFAKQHRDVPCYFFIFMGYGGIVSRACDGNAFA